MSRPQVSGEATRRLSARCVLESCGREFQYDPTQLTGNTSFPFCSPRCKGADLGNWVNEDYRIEDPRDPDELPGPIERPGQPLTDGDLDEDDE